MAPRAGEPAGGHQFLLELRGRPVHRDQQDRWGRLARRARARRPHMRGPSRAGAEGAGDGTSQGAGTWEQRRVRPRTAPWPGGPAPPLTMGTITPTGDHLRPRRTAPIRPGPPQSPVPAASTRAARIASWKSFAQGPGPATTNGDSSTDANASGSVTYDLAQASTV